MVDATYQARRSTHVDETRQALARVFNAQRAEALANQTLDRDIWDPRLQTVVLDRNSSTARDFAALVAADLPGDFDPAVMDAWLEENARITAEGINERTLERMGRAMQADQPVFELGNLFTTLAGVSAGVYATQMVTTAANFGAADAAEKAGARTKTWQVNSGNPRSEHAALDGQTRPIGEPFSNGMMWPGHPDGGAENNANCACSVRFGRGDS